MPVLIPYGDSGTDAFNAAGLYAGAISGGMSEAQNRTDALREQDFQTAIRESMGDRRAERSFGYQRAIRLADQNDDLANRNRRTKEMVALVRNLRNSVPADRHDELDLMAADYIEKGEMRPQWAEYLGAMKEKDRAKVVIDSEKLGLLSRKTDAQIRQGDERTAIAGRNADTSRMNADTNLFRAFTGSEQGAARIAETGRANQAREAQAAKNADALAGDRRNRGAAKMSIPDKAEFDRLDDRYKELMKQGDAARADTEDPGRALSLYAGARAARESMNAIAAKYAAPSASPGATQPPPGAGLPPDIDPNAVADAVRKIRRENPLMTKEQVEAELMRLLGGR